MFYDRDIRGLWVSAEGMIYLDFDYSKHTCSANDIKDIQFKEYFAGVDWGFEHFGVIAVYGVDHDGKFYRLEETAERIKGIDYWVKEALNYNEKYKCKMLFYCDDARPDNMQEFRKAGLAVRGANKSVVEGIAHVASLYKQNKIMIVRETNKNYLLEIYNYRWKENSVKEEPIKEQDDSMDTERYALFSHNKKNIIEFF
jgi:PBSX family phage terminase large subunit